MPVGRRVLIGTYVFVAGLAAESKGGITLNKLAASPGWRNVIQKRQPKIDGSGTVETQAANSDQLRLWSHLE